MQLRIELTVISQTAISVGAGGSIATIADKSIVRDGWGRPLIPGSQVKGKLRWAAEQLLRGLGKDIPAPFEGAQREEHDTPVRQLFGSPMSRSPLFFAHLPGIIGDLSQAESIRAQPTQHLSQIRPSVTINRHRRTAAESLLLFQETALETTRFHSSRAITGQINDLSQAALLWIAARLSSRWGGAKSRGLGWAKVETNVFVDGQACTEDELRTALRALIADVGGRP
ncbi:RAMP superfamily CRISPR-associated protein [Chloroflexus sp.]|uniref:RAMP superfamily CRISPR-associated protein n=1 Tax=Chloroflexus sp. TaxID=1904827 RepID=UPI002614529B|nr:RAMP superfamily CRISPR-associated protein [uncultured Chloroflexus sp.]